MIDRMEEVIDKMTARAEMLLAEINQQFTITEVLAAFSGGNDSIVSTHWTMSRFTNASVMTANTRVALRPSLEHISRVVTKHNWTHMTGNADAEGPPKGFVGKWRDGESAYEEFVLNYGFPGPAQHGRMYQRLKQRQFRKVKRLFGRMKPKTRILVVSGIRADESAIRAGYRRAYQEEPSECFVWFNPFYDFTALDFEAYRQWHGLTRNPVKDLCGISGECCCGAFAAPGERMAYRVADPAFANYLDNLESRVREQFPWGWESGPSREWKDRQAGQLRLFDDPEPDFRPACVGCHRKIGNVTSPAKDDSN